MRGRDRRALHQRRRCWTRRRLEPWSRNSSSQPLLGSRQRELNLLADGRLQLTRDLARHLADEGVRRRVRSRVLLGRRAGLRRTLLEAVGCPGGHPLRARRWSSRAGLARSSLGGAQTGARPAGSRERRAGEWPVAAPKTRWQWQSHAANLQGRHEQRDAEKSFEGVPGGGNNCLKKTKELPPASDAPVEQSAPSKCAAVDHMSQKPRSRYTPRKKSKTVARNRLNGNSSLYGRM